MKTVILNVAKCIDCPFIYEFAGGDLSSDKVICTVGLYMGDDWRVFTDEECLQGNGTRKLPSVLPEWCKLKKLTIRIAAEQ